MGFVINKNSKFFYKSTKYASLGSFDYIFELNQSNHIYKLLFMALWISRYIRVLTFIVICVCVWTCAHNSHSLENRKFVIHFEQYWQVEILFQMHSINSDWMLDFEKCIQHKQCHIFSWSISIVIEVFGIHLHMYCWNSSRKKKHCASEEKKVLKRHWNCEIGQKCLYGQ